MVKQFMKETVQSLVIALILALLIRMFIFQPFYIPSRSMVPNLEPGDRILVTKFNYYFSEPERGEVIVFKYPVDPDKDFVKRIVGLGGESLSIKGNNVYINGKLLNEPYLKQGIPMQDFGPVTIPNGTLFVMGDNRPDSRDSRYWGTLDKNLIIGKTIFRFWPLGRIGRVQ